MFRIIAVTIFIFFVSVGCSKKLELSRDTNSNQTALENYIPIGTPIDKAINQLTSNGFTKIEQEKEQEVFLKKGGRVIGSFNVKNVSVFSKENNESKWIVYLICDNAEKVTEHYVTSSGK